MRILIIMLLFIGVILISAGVSQQTTQQKATNGVEVSVNDNLIELKADSISENIVDEIKTINNVVRVEKYLYLKTNPHDVIGVELLNPLRINGEIAEVRAGRNFEEGDENVAIVGRRVNSNLYGGAEGMMLPMAHFFSVGQSFTLNNKRIIIVGIYLTKSKDLQESIFLPLPTAQKLYDKDGKISNIFVQVDSQKNIDSVLQQVENILKGG